MTPINIKILTNDFDWDSKEFNFKNGLNSKFIGKIKNVNFETKNVDSFKEETTSEIHGALGYQTKLELIKEIGPNRQNLFTPKFLIRYSPGAWARNRGLN